jgi:hypothetical protein
VGFTVAEDVEYEPMLGLLQDRFKRSGNTVSELPTASRRDGDLDSDMSGERLSERRASLRLRGPPWPVEREISRGVDRRHSKYVTAQAQDECRGQVEDAAVSAARPGPVLPLSASLTRRGSSF